MTRLYQKYRRIAKSISPLEISTDFSRKDLGWDDDLFGGSGGNTTSLFLGKYSEDGIHLFIKRFGLDRKVRKIGIKELSVDVDTKDPYKHILTVYQGKTKERSKIIMELIGRYQYLEPKKEDSDFLYTESLRVLMIEWLLLQNPGGGFDQKRPRLPGQQHPGLGFGDELLALFSLMGRHLRVDGLLNIPQYLHTGMFFSKRSLFLSPVAQAAMIKVTMDLMPHYPLWKIAWAGATESILNQDTGEYYQWEPRKQILPLNPQLKQYFRSGSYLDVARNIPGDPIFTIDDTKLESALRKLDNPPLKF